MEQDSSSMEKRFSYKFLKRMLLYVDSAQEFIAHLGKCEVVKPRGTEGFERTFRHVNPCPFLTHC